MGSLSSVRNSSSITRLKSVKFPPMLLSRRDHIHQQPIPKRNPTTEAPAIPSSGGENDLTELPAEVAVLLVGVGVELVPVADAVPVPVKVKVRVVVASMAGETSEVHVHTMGVTVLGRPVEIPDAVE